MNPNEPHHLIHLESFKFETSILMKAGMNTGINDFSQGPFPVFAQNSKRTFRTHTVPRFLDPIGPPLPQPKPKQRRHLKPKQKTKQRRPKNQKRPKIHKQRM